MPGYVAEGKQQLAIAAALAASTAPWRWRSHERLPQRRRATASIAHRDLALAEGADGRLAADPQVTAPGTRRPPRSRRPPALDGSVADPQAEGAPMAKPAFTHPRLPPPSRRSAPRRPWSGRASARGHTGAPRVHPHAPVHGPDKRRRGHGRRLHRRAARGERHAPGDDAQCLAAMALTPPTTARAFKYRFPFAGQPHAGKPHALPRSRTQPGRSRRHRHLRAAAFWAPGPRVPLHARPRDARGAHARRPRELEGQAVACHSRTALERVTLRADRSIEASPPALEAIRKADLIAIPGRSSHPSFEPAGAGRGRRHTRIPGEHALRVLARRHAGRDLGPHGPRAR